MAALIGNRHRGGIIRIMALCLRDETPCLRVNDFCVISQSCPFPKILFLCPVFGCNSEHLYMPSANILIPFYVIFLFCRGGVP
jgi:hypothetical protein